MRTATIQPAFGFLAYLNKYSATDLFSVPIKHVKKAIQTAMFNELTIFGVTLTVLAYMLYTMTGNPVSLLIGSTHALLRHLTMILPVATLN